MMGIKIISLGCRKFELEMRKKLNLPVQIAIKVSNIFILVVVVVGKVKKYFEF